MKRPKRLSNMFKIIFPSRRLVHCECRYAHFINGDWSDPKSGEYFVSTNPATLEQLYEAARGNEQDVNLAVEAAEQAFHSSAWANMTQTARGKLLRKLGDLIGENAEELARLES